MKRGFSLIELVISMVIIAIVFTVIPKILYVSKQAESFVIKEDALFNGFALISIILKLPWDQNNTNSNDILRVDSKLNDCNDTNIDNEPAAFYRVGGFVGSRNCIEHNATLLASHIEHMGIKAVNFNDIDDYNGYDQNTTNPITENSIYNLATTVDYVDDNIITYSNQNATVNLSNTVSANSTTNIKRVRLHIKYQGNRKSQRDNSISFINYYSANIGQTYLREIIW